MKRFATNWVVVNWRERARGCSGAWRPLTGAAVARATPARAASSGREASRRRLHYGAKMAAAAADGTHRLTFGPWRDATWRNATQRIESNRVGSNRSRSDPVKHDCNQMRCNRIFQWNPIWSNWTESNAAGRTNGQVESRQIAIDFESNETGWIESKLIRLSRRNPIETDKSKSIRIKSSE